MTDPCTPPPGTKDALLREALTYVETVEQITKNFGMTDHISQKPGDLAARIRASLKGE